MNCEKCGTKFPYGARYCNKCGEVIPKDAHEEQYQDTIWSKIDWAKEKYDTFFLKKITGSVLFKIITMLLVLGYLLFTISGNFAGIRLSDTDSYSIEYNKKLDNYYICPRSEVSHLDFHAPLGTEKIIFTEYIKGKKTAKEYTPEQYKKEGYSISAGQYEYITIAAKKDNKTLDKIKIIVTGVAK